MGQATIVLQTFKENINPLNWVQNPDVREIRVARRDFNLKANKDVKIEAKAAASLLAAIKTGSIEGVLKSFNQLCNVSLDELEQYSQGLFKLILVINREFKRLKVAYDQETDPELKKIMGEDIKELREHAQKWFQRSQSAESMTIHLADATSLKAEVAHLLDPFNLPMLARQVYRQEKKLVKDENKKIKARDKSKYSKKELDDLKKLASALGSYLSANDLVFRDVTRIMQLEAQRISDELNSISDKLRSLKYPQENMDKITHKLNETTTGLHDEFRNLSEHENGLIRILESVKV